MGLEERFFCLAVRESNFPNNDSPEEQAAIAVMGGIDQPLPTDDRDEFVSAGLRYVDEFDSHADDTIANIHAAMDYCDLQDDEHRLRRVKQVIREIDNLRRLAHEVDRDAIRVLFEQDWDERNAEPECAAA